MAERILVVDDEDAVRDYCARALDVLGYEPTTAASGRHALDLLHNLPFDLLLTDVVMPGMSGLQLLGEARALDPDLVAVLITGHGDIEMAIRALREGARGFVLKPFGIRDLQEAIEHALEQARLVRERHRLRALLPLLELSQRGLDQIETRTFAGEILDLALRETAAEAGSLLILPSKSSDQTLLVTRGALPGHLHDRAWLSERALALQQPETATRADAHNLLVPLRAPHRTAGLLALARAKGRFGPGEVDLATVLGAQVAAILDNHRLVRHLENWNRDLEARVQAYAAELSEAHERLLRNERLAVVGKLGAGVAHELRNPLGVISNSVYYLQSRLGDADEKAAKHLQIIAREVQTSNRIISDLMGFVRSHQLETADHAPDALVTAALERSVVPPEVRIETRFANDLPPVTVDAEKMQQVFVNLIQNAVQAMPEGGELVISTGLQGGQVTFAFADTGIGIPPEHLERIFEPLYTTKARGIGLGLAVVQLLVEAHQGRISVDSRAGEGACFTVHLPQSPTPQEEATQP